MLSSRGSSDPGIKSMSPPSPALAGRAFTTSATWEASNFFLTCSFYCFSTSAPTMNCFFKKLILFCFCIIKKNTIYYYYFATPCSMWDFSSVTRDQTHAPVMEAQNLNHWTAREVPKLLFSDHTDTSEVRPSAAFSTVNVIKGKERDRNCSR